MSIYKLVIGRRLGWIAALFVVLLALAIPAVTSYKTTSRVLTKEVEDRRSTIAKLVQQNLTEEFNQLTALNRRFAASDTYRQIVTNKQWDLAASRLATVATDFPYIEGVFITDQADVIRVDVGEGAAKSGTHIGTQDWYKTLTTTRTSGISSVYNSNISGSERAHNVVAIMSPIYSNGDASTLIGWFGFRVPLDEIGKSSSAVTIGTQGFVYITDALGQLASHPSFNVSQDIVNFSSAPVVQRVLQGQEGVDVLYNPIEKEERLVAYIGEPTYHWGVVVAQPSHEAFAERTNLQNFIKTLYAIVFLAILAVSAVALYLTSRLRETNEATSKQAARNRAIFASMGEGLIVVNEYGNIIEANPMALELLGFSWPELRGKWFPKAVVDVDNRGREVAVTERPILQTLETGQPVAAKANYITKSGAHLPVFVTAAPFLVDKRPMGAINIFRDRTEEMKIEHTKDEFVSLASHQLRTPLTSMRLFTEMLMDGHVGQLKPKQKNYLRKVEISTERMIKLVADILNISRLELGRLKISPVPTDLVELIKTYIEEIEPLAKEKEVKIVFQTPPNKLPKIQLDPIMMGQIIHNLLSNAVHYTKAKNGLIEVTLARNTRGFTFSVSDNGIGIPKGFKPRIFQRFGRADNAIAVEGQGTGLGLYLIKMIVDTTGGKIAFKSTEGKGTAFYVSFPETGMKPGHGDKDLNK